MSKLDDLFPCTWAPAKAKALALEGWTSVADDERLQTFLAPFIGFMEVRNPDFEPAENIDELLDEAATAIPRATTTAPGTENSCHQFSSWNIRWT